MQCSEVVLKSCFEVTACTSVHFICKIESSDSLSTYISVHSLVCLTCPLAVRICTSFWDVTDCPNHNPCQNSALASTHAQRGTDSINIYIGSNYFIARIIALKAWSDLNFCILSEQRMAKCPPLSTGTVKSKRFDFTLDDNNFEEHTWGFVPHEWSRVCSNEKKCEKCTVAIMASVLALLLHYLCFWGAEGAPILFSEIGFYMASCSYIYNYIRRHGSDVYLGMSLVQNGGSYLMY